MKRWAGIVLCLLVLTTETLGNLLDGLILHLPCDEGEGTTLRDASATRSPAELVGRATWAASRNGLGTALDFRNDEESFITLTHDFGNLSRLSVSCHFLAQDPDPLRWGYFLDTRSDAITEAEGAFYLARNRDQVLRFVDEEAPADSYPRKTWAHLVVLADRQEVQFYVDGNRVGKGNPIPLSVGNRLLIGNRYTKNAAFTGILDDIGLWDRLLDATEIIQLRDRPIPSPQPVEARGRLPIRWAQWKRERAVLIERGADE